MAGFPDTQADLKLDADGRIDLDVRCVSCGYNLRGLLPEGRCPECGTAVGRSTRGDFLRFCDPAWVEKLASGMNWILTSIIVSIVVGGLGSGLVGATGNPGFGLLGVLGGMVGFVGYWRVTTPDPRQSEPDRLDARTLIRYGWPVSLVFSLAAQFVPQFSLWWDATLLLSSALGLVITVCIFVYARRLAARIPDNQLSSQTRIVMWGFVAVSILSMVTFGVMLLSGPKLLAGIATARTGGPGRGTGAGPGSAQAINIGIAAAIAVTGCAAGIVSLVFSIWALVLVIRYRSAFSRATQDARATWAGSAPDLPAPGMPKV
jgi:hypothetical protein